jgi:hypothetical protein
MLEVSSITSFENESDQLFVMGEVINSGTVHASQIKIGLSVKRVGVERIEPVSSAVTDPEALPIGAVYPFWFRVNEASSVEEFDVTAIAFRTIDEVASEGIELIDDLIELRPYSPTLVNDNQQFLVTWFRKNTLKEELGFVPGALTFYDESGAVVGVVGIRGPRELAPGATARLLGAVTSDMLPDFPASYRITAAGKLPGRNAGALYITKENDRFETPEISVSIQTNTGYLGFGSGWLYGEVTNTGNLPTRGPDITITMSDGRTASGPGLIGFDGILDPGETVPYQALYGAQSDDIKTVDSVEWSTRFYRELPEPPRPEATVSGLSFKEIVDNVRIGNRRVDAVVNEITGTVTNNTEHTLSVSLSGVLRSGGVIVDIMSHNGVNNTTDLRHFEPGERFNFKFQSRPNNLGTDAEVRQSVQCKTCP